MASSTRTGSDPPGVQLCTLIDFSGNSATGWQLLLLQQFDHDQRRLRLAIMVFMYDS
jgi:hypothetical protein